MFCPKCATNNLEGVSFCRGCGANISLIPHAMTGQIAAPETEEVASGGRGRKRSKEVTLDHSFKNIFMGVAFLIVAIGLSRSIGHGWWFWMLLPAFSMMGTGIAQYIRLKEREKRQSLDPPLPTRVFAPPRSEELIPPPSSVSVTEGTTRHLKHNQPK